MIEKNGSNIVIGSTSIDLTPYQGQKVTIFQEDDGSLTCESKATHQTTICELIVPKPNIVSQLTGEVDGEGKPIARDIIQPLYLTNVDIVIFEGGV